ncbi:MAG TPA: bifunctional DNA-binding transcriptional regulator/O6-methylguanine-DNA methyltransferase Ada [Ktedonobacteraceae bacterium]|nr:bifunctional DNA-binding transcriptional regulator/O6-methylguanine-DNA methyltransferase Ada [Ktedonobacteraceae bacterium]
MRNTVEEIKQEQLDEEQCWRAVLARNAAADGTFVVAVRTTHVYCRPSCPARHPYREHVTFYRLPEEASADGYRPCKRCHPDQVHQPDPQAELVEQVCQYVQTHLDAPLQLADLSQQFHISTYHLQRTFKRVKGVTPRQFVESCRLGDFKARLQGGVTVTDALYNAGYQSSSSVYERAPVHLGMTPTAYRRGGKGMRIGYTIVESPLGYVLVAATERGVAAVRFGDSEQSIEADFVREYPKAELIRDDEQLSPWANLLLLSLQGKPSEQQVSLDVHGTTFQWKVWQALRAIPVGQTRSYQEIARAIGQPTASRAVAQACATNPVAVFIPCHRVIRNNGQLGGYHWGIERKQQLLANEKATHPLGQGNGD